MLNLFITNSTSGLFFDSMSNYNNENIVMVSILSSLQSIARVNHTESFDSPFVSTFFYQNKLVKIFSSLKNDFIFVSDYKDDNRNNFNISEEQTAEKIDLNLFLEIYDIFSDIVCLDPNYNENIFCKNKEFSQLITEILTNY